MIRNVVLMRLPDDAPPETRTRLEAGLAGIAALHLAGSLGAHVGLDAGLRAGGWSAAIVSDWADESAYAAYDADPEHLRWRAEIEDVCDEVARVQLTIGDDRIQSGSEAWLLAGTLAGLTEVEAVRRAVDAGFTPDVVPPGVTAVTMDFRPRRIRLFVDEAHHVIRATGG
jgi:Stress responsive A/B Barrel Domain